MQRARLAGLLILALGPLAAAAGGQATLLDSARARLARVEGEIVVPGLDSAVEVRRDHWGVPHIYARTTHDLFFAQGYVVAQDRLWQMEMWRRTGEGRLAEVLGPEFVERDKAARLLLYRGDPDAEWNSYAPDARRIIEAFVEGVNAQIREARTRPPIEFTLLGFLPEPWSPTVPLQRLGALAMTDNASDEIRRAVLVASLGKTRTQALLPTDPFRALDPVAGLDLRGISSASLGAIADGTGIEYPRLEGSNNWVVSGTRTKSGKPLLANDPHRTVSLPSLRYLTHLVGPGWNVIGAGEPGVPGVAGGHNGRVGFGFTIVGMDQQDVYVERLAVCPGFRRSRAARDGTAPRCVWHEGRWVPLKTILDTIPVKGGPSRVVRLEFSHHGPIVAEDTTRHRGFALRFVGSEPGTAGYLAQLSLDRVNNWTEFRDAAARWKLPTENLVYADTAGNIGWVAAGLMPVRRWSGLLPVPGDGSHEWEGFVPPERLPSAFNPPSGFIATANHNILPAGYTTPINYDWADPFRYNRIAEVLSDSTGFTREDFERLQHDELSLPARTLVPILIGALNRVRPALPPPADSAALLLRGWDFVMRKEAAAPLIYSAWLRSLRPILLARWLRGPTSPGRNLPLGMRVMTALLVRPDSLLGPGGARARDSLVIRALRDAVADLGRSPGGTPGGWRWGDVHLAGFRHPLARAFDLPAVPRGGDGNTVNATGGAGFRQTSGASYRIVVDLGDLDRSSATSVPGQSGQPGSEFYGNLLPLWGEGRYFPLVYSRAAVERETKYVLWMKPN